ncbi:uncharacterized protein LOC110641576 isoform X2 [Hevea brasiliensis]|uniref:uncharacterized protein LOC110641576 isoform X2 n=1 Tax=Hevea brasiliensis TaxID=3981 RepID=UPI0025FAF9AF|nr:uncharacterized protein LOC110641576 isoform X2 [Hevea brasiliensis]
MGKEWYWVAGKSSKIGGVGGGGRLDKDRATNFSGCMCSVFQLFDFHQFQFPSHQQQPSLKPESFLSQPEPEPEPELPISKGAEAPRNSLESDEPSSPTIEAEDKSLNIPMGIQIKTNVDGNSSVQGAPKDSSSSEISSSPSTKTPNLVARLMGLDLLPDQSYSPTFSSSTLGTPNPRGKYHLHHHFRHRQFLQSKPSSHRSGLDSDFSGALSLPETPRISSARRSDVEHRLSLQINKENLSPNEELVLSRISSLKRKELKTEDENRSPGHYARQIVKQVKESVSRKVGLEITNTVKNRERASGDELVIQLKSKKMSKVLTKVNDGSSPGQHSTASCSPRLKFLEPRNRPIFGVPSAKEYSISQSLKPSISAHSLVNTKAPTKPKLRPMQQQKYHHHHRRRPIKKCKKVAEERFGPPLSLTKPPQSSDAIRKKREESFVRPAVATVENIPDENCKKTPLSNDLLNATFPTLLPVRNDPTLPATKIPQKPAPNAQESKRISPLSSCSSHSYKQQEAPNARGSNEKCNNGDRSNGAAATTKDRAAAEYEYITRILRRTGIDKDTPVSFTSERYAYGQLSHRCNRKLLFDLVDEILAEILKPYKNLKPWATSSSGSRGGREDAQGSHLIDMLYSKVRSFPCADCRVLEDIDALVDKDMPLLKLQTEVAFGDEGEGIVTEIEKYILDSIIHETAAFFCDDELRE